MLKNLNRMKLLEEKLKLLNGLSQSAVRALALAVLVVASLKSSLPVEIKTIIISGALWANISLSNLAEVASGLTEAQSETTHFSQLVMISLETQRLSPNDKRGALSIQGAVEKAAQETIEYSIMRGSVSDALAQYLIGSFFKLAIVGATIAAVWLAWGASHSITSRWISWALF